MAVYCVFEDVWASRQRIHFIRIRIQYFTRSLSMVFPNIPMSKSPSQGLSRCLLKSLSRRLSNGLSKCLSIRLPQYHPYWIERPSQATLQCNISLQVSILGIQDTTIRKTQPVYAMRRKIIRYQAVNLWIRLNSVNPCRRLKVEQAVWGIKS